MYEQLELFGLEQTDKKAKTMFEQILPVIDNPIIQCANCLCQYCTHNAEELGNTISAEEAADTPCFICDECRIYSGDSNQKILRKEDCDNFIMSDHGAKRNRKRFKVISKQYQLQEGT